MCAKFDFNVFIFSKITPVANIKIPVTNRAVPAIRLGNLGTKPVFRYPSVARTIRHKLNIMHGRLSSE